MDGGVEEWWVDGWMERWVDRWVDGYSETEIKRQFMLQEQHPAVPQGFHVQQGTL